MALADVYEVRMWGNVLNSNWNLVFHALRASGAYDAEDVMNAASQTWLDELAACMSSDATFEGISAKSLGNPLDFAEYGYTATAGGKGSDCFSPFAAFTIRFTRKRTDMHHGYKRIAGVSEADVADGVVAAGQETLLGAFAAAVMANWELSASPGTAVANYIVVKRVLDAGTYRMPATDGELVYYQPSSAVVSHYISSQNSRKFRP